MPALELAEPLLEVAWPVRVGRPAQVDRRQRAGRSEVRRPEEQSAAAPRALAALRLEASLPPEELAVRVLPRPAATPKPAEPRGWVAPLGQVAQEVAPLSLAGLPRLAGGAALAAPPRLAGGAALVEPLRLAAPPPPPLAALVRVAAPPPAAQEP